MTLDISKLGSTAFDYVNSNDAAKTKVKDEQTVSVFNESQTKSSISKKDAQKFLEENKNKELIDWLAEGGYLPKDGCIISTTKPIIYKVE